MHARTVFTRSPCFSGCEVSRGIYQKECVWRNTDVKCHESTRPAPTGRVIADHRRCGMNETEYIGRGTGWQSCAAALQLKINRKRCSQDFMTVATDGSCGCIPAGLDCSHIENQVPDRNIHIYRTGALPGGPNSRNRLYLDYVTL